MAWTDEEVFTVRRLAGDGKSASQIASILGAGVTKNRVIALCYRAKPRIKLMARSGPKVGKPQKRRAKPAPPVRSGSLAPAQSLPGAGVKFVILEEVGGEVHHDLLRAGDNRCRFPMWPDRLGDLGGKPQRTELYYCGKPTCGGSWCEEHHKVVFQKVPTKTARGEGRKVDPDGRRAGWQYGT